MSSETDVRHVADCLEIFADTFEKEFSMEAVAGIKGIGSWRGYGEKAMSIYGEALQS